MDRSNDENVDTPGFPHPCPVQNGSPANLHDLRSNPAMFLACDNKGRTAAHNAALNNNVRALESIVEYTGSLDGLDQDGNSPLHIAVSSEAVDCIDFLLQNGVNANILNLKNQSVLHIAAELGKVESLKAMSKHAANFRVNQGGDRGRTALHLACIYDRSECVKILIEDFDASPRRACALSFLPVHEAAKYGSFNALKSLLESGARCGCPTEDMMNFPDHEGNSALHFAVQGSHVKVVRLCMESGAKISVSQKDAWTPMHFACAQGSTEIVSLAFELQPEEANWSMNLCDLERLTPLHYAAMFDHVHLVQFLVIQGIDLNPLDKNHCTPLHLAAVQNAYKAIKCLIMGDARTEIIDKDGMTFLHAFVKHKGDFAKIADEETAKSLIPILDKQDNDGHTAVHIAVKNGLVNSARELLRMGSSITLENLVGDNVFQMACRYGKAEVVEHIAAHDQFATVLNGRNYQGWTPVHFAAYEGHANVLQMLMQKGAFLRKADDGRTPLHLAAENGHSEIVSLILKIHTHLIDVIDHAGNTPLHSATINNQAKVAELLLLHYCKISYNNDGYSAIDIAMMNESVEVARVMVTHKTRGKEVLGLTNGKYKCIMEELIVRMPAVAKVVLDAGIQPSTTEKQDSPTYNVGYDFRWLDIQSEDDTDRQKRRRGPYLPILNVMAKNDRVDLLSHELSVKYMEMKWKSYGKYFHFSNLLFYLIYLYILTIVSTNEIERDFKFYVRFRWYNESDEQCLARNESCSMPTFVGRGTQEVNAFRLYRKNTHHYEWRKFEYGKICLMATFAGFNLLLELINICRHGLKYFENIDTWVWITMNISCITANFFQIIARQFKADATISYDLVNPSLAYAVFMGWFYLFIMMQRFDAVGIYVTMFLEILKTMLRVLVVFSALIIAFALAFHVLLANGNHAVFFDFPMALARTFSMILGDMDFMYSLFFPYHCEQMEKNNLTDSRMYTTMGECKNSRRVPHPYATFSMVCIFLVFIPIVMVNLLIGLAVGDIAKVKKNAELKRLSMQVQTHTNMEKFLPSCILKRVSNKSFVVDYPNARKTSCIVRYLTDFFQDEKMLDDKVHPSTDSAAITKAMDRLSVDVSNIKSIIAHISSKLDAGNGVYDDGRPLGKCD